MKVVRLYDHGGPEAMKIEETSIPVPGMNEVIVRVNAIAVNYSEVQQRQGTYPFPSQLPMVMGQWAVVSGVITELGENVKNLAVGIPIISQVPEGAYAEYVRIPEYLLVPVPQRMNSAQAATLLTHGQTAYHLLKTAGKLQGEDTVLIHAGAGGVGSLAIQIAKALGAKKIVATASTEEKMNLMASLGADETINYTNPGWTQQVLEATEGKGADLILEMAGGDILKGSLNVLAPFGRLVYYGSASAKDNNWDQIDLVSLLSNKSITGFNIAHLLGSDPEKVREGLEALFTMSMTGKLNPVVKHVIPLSEAAEAHRLIESRQTVGTVILQPQ